MQVGLLTNPLADDDCAEMTVLFLDSWQYYHMVGGFIANRTTLLGFSEGLSSSSSIVVVFRVGDPVEFL